MAGLPQGSEPAVAASPTPAVAASPEDLASLRVSQPIKLSNVPLKWIRDSCEDPRGTPTTDCVVLSPGSEPAVAGSRRGASDKRAVAVEAHERPGFPPAEGWKKYGTTYWEQEGCDFNLELDHADALAAKGLPDDGSNRCESFLDARRAAYWKADQLVRQDQDQDAAEQAQTSKQGQQALEDLRPVASPKALSLIHI